MAAAEWAASLDNDVSQSFDIACAWTEELVAPQATTSDATRADIVSEWTAEPDDAIMTAAADWLDDSDTVENIGQANDATITAPPTAAAITTLIDATDQHTTLAHIHAINTDIVTLLSTQTHHEEIGQADALFDTFLQALATKPSTAATNTLAKWLDDEAVATFAKDQLQTTDNKHHLSLESHTAEAKRLGQTANKLRRKRDMIGTAVVAMQRSFASKFVHELCNRCEAAGGQCVSYIERHRGDETPFAKVSAHDEPNDDGLIQQALEDAKQPTLLDSPAPTPTTLAVNNSESTVVPAPISAHTVSANLKVYNTDLEIALLFVMPDAELLVTFKMLCPLTRVDRCTGLNYARLHARQANVLSARTRFFKNQRMQTSDGDKAHYLAERALAHELQQNDNYPVPTFR